MPTLDVSLRAPRMATGGLSLWSSRRWSQYFHRQRGALLPIPWEAGAGLTAAERDVIASSLQVFQQGEAQEGKHFFRCAQGRRPQ